MRRLKINKLFNNSGPQKLEEEHRAENTPTIDLIPVKVELDIDQSSLKSPEMPSSKSTINLVEVPKDLTNTNRRGGCSSCRSMRKIKRFFK